VQDSSESVGGDLSESQCTICLVRVQIPWR